MKKTTAFCSILLIFVFLSTILVNTKTEAQDLVITVNSSNDTESGDCPDFCTLRSAIEMAEKNSVISVEVDHITINPDLEDIPVFEPISILGNGVVIDGGDQTRMFSIDPLNGEVLIQDMILQNGVATSGGGGCITLLSGRLVLYNVELEFCHSMPDVFPGSGEGGAIRLGQNVALYMIGGHITHSSAANHGGALASLNPWLIYVEGTHFLENDSLTGDGGAIYAPRSPIELIDSRFVHNGSLNGKGGAIYASDARLDKTFMSNNFSLDGTIYIEESASFSMINTVMMDNTGGGISADGSTGYLFSSTLYNNNNDLVGDMDLVLSHSAIESCTHPLNSHGYNAFSSSCAITPTKGDISFHPSDSYTTTVDSHGTTTLVHTHNSALIDAGYSQCSTPYDVYGESRPVNTTGTERAMCDIGAIESPPNYITSIYLPWVAMTQQAHSAMATTRSRGGHHIKSDDLQHVIVEECKIRLPNGTWHELQIEDCQEEIFLP